MRLIWLFVLGFGISGCVDRSLSPTTPTALSIGKNQTIFAATSRVATQGGQYGFDRSTDLSLLELTVSIPPTHTAGQLEFGYAKPDPTTQFVMAGRQEFGSHEAFNGRVRQYLSKLPPDQRETTIFVHGFNATQAETAFRAAQLAEDMLIPGAMMIYSWPSQGKPLGYVYDNDSMLFARDGLESLLREVGAHSPKKVVLVAHSLGSALLMETLRQIEMQTPGWAARELGGVVLISPDLDIEVFRGQIAHFATIPQPFVLFVSKKDKVLGLSSLLRGRGRVRLGNIDNLEKISDLPIEIIDTTELSASAGSSHFVPATSPALLAMFAEPNTLHRTFDSEERSLENLLVGNTILTGQVTEIVLLLDGPAK